MQEAIRLARLGLGTTSPNPMVGAVVVRDGKIVGKGYHKRKGESHAEVIALKEAGSSANGSTLYVNFEPCCHFGATPPCTQAIIEAGIKEVYVSIVDPSPWVNGKGIEELRSAGINVILGDCEEEAVILNEVYLKYVRTGIPFVSLKAAITLDGKIATSNGKSEWITTEESRKFVHRLRSQVDAVMVGIGTVLKDNPELTVRLVKGRNPMRIVLDSNLRIPPGAKVLGPGCIIATTVRNQAIKQSSYQCELWGLKRDKLGMVDLFETLKKAGESGIQSILIEGGREVFTQALLNKIVDRVYFFIAPKILGGSPLGDGISVVGDLGIKSLKDALSLSQVRYRKLGNDILIEGRL